MTCNSPCNLHQCWGLDILQDYLSTVAAHNHRIQVSFAVKERDTADNRTCGENYAAEGRMICAKLVSLSKAPVCAQRRSHPGTKREASIPLLAINSSLEYLALIADGDRRQNSVSCRVHLRISHIDMIFSCMTRNHNSLMYLVASSFIRPVESCL